MSKQGIGVTMSIFFNFALAFTSDFPYKTTIAIVGWVGTAILAVMWIRAYLAEQEPSASRPLIDLRGVPKERVPSVHIPATQSEVSESWADLFKERKRVQEELDRLELGERPPDIPVSQMQVKFMTPADIHANQERQRAIERKKKELELIDQKLPQPQNANKAELLALRTLAGELNEEVGTYAPNKDLHSLLERLETLERAAGTFGHATAFRQSVRDLHHTLRWMVHNKQRGDIAMMDVPNVNFRDELEERYQRFLRELNHLL